MIQFHLMRITNNLLSMGTRGLFGFYYKGKYYLAYNHWDSYPTGLGANIVEQIKEAIREGSFEQWTKLLDNIVIVDMSKEPTEEDIKKLSKYTNLGASSQSTSDWYCLLRNCQGSLQSVLDSGYLMNHVDDEGCPCFEEYAYVVNFDTNRFDVYVGAKKVESYEFTKLPNFNEDPDSECE